MGEVQSIQMQEPPATPVEEPTQEPTQETPEPTQEETIQEQAKAYTEAQKKLSERQGIQETEAPAEGDISETVNAARTEFFENDGKLSDDTYKALEQSGMPKEAVDAFIEGQTAKAELYNLQLQSIGGDQHQSALEWGGDNLSDAEIAAFNSEYTSGDITRATVAMKGLLAQYQVANGKPGKLLQGETSGTAGIQAYASKQEWLADMKDPKYKANDTAFHAQVQKRLAVTDISKLK
jgi:hypothetical protein